MFNPISPLILSKVPAFLKAEHPYFYEFLRHYFQFLETEENPLDIIGNFRERCELNNEEEIYVEKIIKELGFETNIPLLLSYKEFVPHLRDFYLSKGSVRSFVFLFRALFGSTPFIDYPKTKLLVPSSASYFGRSYVYCTAQNRGAIGYSTLLSSYNLYSIKITGSSSSEQAYVETIEEMSRDGEAYLRIQIDGSDKIFIPGEGLRIESENLGIRIIEDVLNVIGLSIENSGYNYSIGDIISITGPLIKGNARIKTLKSGIITSVEIDNGGTGYAIGDSIYALRLDKGHSFSAVVSSIDTTGNYLKILYDSDFALETKTEFTLEVWVCISSQPQHTMCIIGNRPLSDLNGWSFEITSEGFPVFRYSDSNYILSSRKIFDNRWAHLAVVRDGNSMKIFLNGNLTRTKNNSEWDCFYQRYTYRK